MKWWDIRNFSKPEREFLVVGDEKIKDPSQAESVTCLAFEPSMPSRVGSNGNECK